MTVKAYGPDGSSSGADGRSGDGSLGRKRHRERDVVVRFRPGDGRLKTPCEAGLLLRLGNSDFCLGPRIVQLDPQIQLSDPLIPAGRSATQACLKTFPWDALLLCSMARDMVLGVHQVRPYWSAP